MGRNNYLVVANDDYIRYVKSLIYSIRMCDPDYKVFLYIINPETENFKLFRKKLKSYNVTYGIIKKQLSKDKGLERFSEESAFSANIRGKLLKEIVEKEDLDNLIYIDADSLIKKPLEKLCPEDKDIAFFKRSIDTCSSGLIALNITLENKEKILQMLTCFQGTIEQHGLLKWFSDQTALKDIYHEYILTDIIKFHQLESKNFDWICLEESNIWMGKGAKKERSQYLNLQKKYEELF